MKKGCRDMFAPLSAENILSGIRIFMALKQPSSLQREEKLSWSPEGLCDSAFLL